MKTNKMKLAITLVAFSILTAIFILSCSSVKVLNSWKAENASEIKSKQALVIVRTNNEKARKAFEEAIVKELADRGISALESYKKIPKLHPNKKLSEEDIEQAKEMIRENGFNAVVLSVLKDEESLTKVTREGDHYAGASYSSLFPTYYTNFYGYYAHPAAYAMPRSDGVYIPGSFNTLESVTYVLETLFFNLDAPKDNQLVAAVTSTFENPESANSIAHEYAKAIAKTLKD